MTKEEQIEAYYTGRILEWRQALDQMTDEAVSELRSALLEAKKEIVQRLIDDAKGITSFSEWRREYDESLNEWIDGVLAASVTDTTAVIVEMAAGAALLSIPEYNSILSLNGKAKGVIQTTGLTREQVRQFFSEELIQGELLGDLTTKAFDAGARDSIAHAIRVGVVNGEGYEKIIKRIRIAADEGFTITWNQADLIARTAVQTANNGAIETVFKRNEDLIRGYKRIETLDNHTCRICALADGMFYKIDEKRPSLPAHFKCRGVWSPVVRDWRALDVEGGESEVEKLTRPWGIRAGGSLAKSNQAKLLAGGRIKGDFEEWWKTLTPEQQAATGVGPIRSKLLREGLVKWEELSDKRTGLPVLLKELGFNEAGNPLS